MIRASIRQVAAPVSACMWHDAVVAIAFAMLLCPTAAQAQSAPQAAGGECAVSGRVSNRATGEAIRDATVELTSASQVRSELLSYSNVIFGSRPASPNGGLSTASSSDGTFCFQTAPAGQYVLDAHKTGFLDSSYGAKSHFQMGNVLAVGTAPLRDLTVSLELLSGITGRVTDRYGDAIAEANVVAVKQLWYQGRLVLMPVQGTQSDERGEYRIGKLMPGTYFLYMQPLPFTRGKMSDADAGGQPVRTYYPSALRLPKASPITVTAGEDVRGADISVIRAGSYVLKGRLEGPGQQWSGGSIRLVPGQEDEMSLAAGAGSLSPDGSFEFSGVSPGLYRLAFESAYGAAQMVVDLEGGDQFVRLPVTGNAALRGRVAIEGAPGSNSAHLPKIMLRPADAIVAPSYHVEVDESGGLAADAIRPGKYLLDIAAPAGAFVRSVKVGTSELSRRELDLTRGGTVAVTIAVSYGSATLQGTVTGAGGSGAAGGSPAHVVLVAVPPKLDGSGLYVSATDGTGHFTIGNLPPAKYRVTASRVVDMRLFQDPRMLKSVAESGMEVELQEKESKVMDLPLLSDEAMEQVAGAVAAGGMSGVADLGAGELKRTRPDLDYARILLAGHSHGGDISMLCAREHPAMVQSVISLDNRRVAFPGTKRPRISSIRSSDRPADDGVIPPLEEQAKLGMKVIKLRETIHNDMWDGGSEERKAEITHYINGFLGEEQ